MFNNKTILIPGGTGSFGNAVLRRFLNSDVKEIRIFSRDEKKQDDMRHELQNPKVKFYIGNIRDRQAIDTHLYVPLTCKTPEQTLYGSIFREINTKDHPRIVKSEAKGKFRIAD